MTSGNTIEYLANNQIDREKWDNCISKSNNGLLYAYSFYLDQMATNWDALVLNNYEYVMPLTWRKKYTIYYLYQPFLTAQLGVFGNNLTAELLEAFLNEIPKKFKYWDIFLNHQNVFSINQYLIYRRRNFVLQLDAPYEVLYANYRENIRRNIKKAYSTGCMVDKDFNVEQVVEIAIIQMQPYDKDCKNNTEIFLSLYKLLHQKKQAITYGIRLNDQLLASAVFFFSHKRAYYILVGNHPNGKTLGASHALIDAFIKDHAGQNLLLDFEGSDIRNLAFFYESFGANEEIYAGLRSNKLPFYLKWMKRS